MGEMSIYDVKGILDRIPERATAIERLILSHEGTVQSLLSVLFGVPIRVDVLHQIVKEDYIIRWSNLVAVYSGRVPEKEEVVCSTESVISKYTNYKGFLSGILEKNEGIGQLLFSIGIKNTRDILEFKIDDISFSRIYEIKSSDDTLSIVITEVFRKEPFKKLYG